MSPHPLPERFTLQHENEALVLSWSWKRKSVLPLVLFLVCCPSPCWLHAQGLVEGTVVLKRNGVADGFVKMPWLGYLMMAGALLVAAVFLYFILLNWLNHSTLRAEPGRLRLSHGPIPMPGIELRASDIVQFEPKLDTSVTRTPKAGEQEPAPAPTPPVAGPNAEYILYALTQKGTRYRVVSDLETLEQCLWVERELRRALGMREQVERG